MIILQAAWALHSARVSAHVGNKMADDGCVSHGNVYDHFEEYNEVFSLIDSLPAIVKDFRALEAAQERLTCKDGF